jgi:hypothetical protein
MHGDDDFLEDPVEALHDRRWKALALGLAVPADPPITPLAELLAACSPPAAELVAEVEGLIEAASREEYEPFRYQTAEALKTCGAADSIMLACSAWAKSAVEDGRYTLEHAAVSAMGGMVASAFQLGLLAATAAMLKRRVS